MCGLIYRATGLLKSGAIKYQDRPTWYDVYRVFPPKYEPYIEREPERKTGIPDILYKEDKLRA
jgi:small subunit ribosomal protein S23